MRNIRLGYVSLSPLSRNDIWSRMARTHKIAASLETKNNQLTDQLSTNQNLSHLVSPFFLSPETKKIASAATAPLYLHPFHAVFFHFPILPQDSALTQKKKKRKGYWIDNFVSLCRISEKHSISCFNCFIFFSISFFFKVFLLTRLDFQTSCT